MEQPLTPEMIRTLTTLSSIAVTARIASAYFEMSFTLAHTVLPSPVQGVDDDSMSGWAYANDLHALELRYAALQRGIKPGLRRYNLFWSGLESGVPPSATPQMCAPGFVAVPANETDRVARGYNHFHCFNVAQLEKFDYMFAHDAAIGAASAVIAYASPDFAIHANCTGFPWGSGPPFRLGCLPWNNLADWDDFMLMVRMPKARSFAVVRGLSPRPSPFR